MKQGKQFMKAIMLVLALMVASYILYNVVRSASSGVPTAQAVLYAASDGVSVEGFVVRQETVIPAAYDLVLPTKGEGEKVACGEEVAVTLRSAAAQERQEEINQTEKELEQLRLALAYQSQLTDNEDVAQRIASSAASLAGQVARYFPRGDDIHFDSGTATITTPRKSAPSCDGKRTEAVVNVGFYAFQA